MSITAAAAQLGPLVLSWSVLIALVAIGLGVWAGGRRGAKSAVDATPSLQRIVLVGALAARLGFVWEVRDVYLQHPLEVFDLRDGGWRIEIGLLAACLYGLYLSRRTKALRKPFTVAAATALAISITGNLLLLTIPQAKQTLPTTALTSLDGHDAALSTFVGKPTVVNLWATWCPPCRHEMPLLAKAQAAHPGVNFVFVNQGEGREPIARYLDAEHLALRNVLLDARLQIGRGLGYQAMPTTLFFDARGTLVDTRIGALSTATLYRHLDSLQVEPASAPHDGQVPPHAGTRSRS